VTATGMVTGIGVTARNWLAAILVLIVAGGILCIFSYLVVQAVSGTRARSSRALEIIQLLLRAERNSHDVSPSSRPPTSTHTNRRDARQEPASRPRRHTRPR
jgi:hypothetical protein